MPEDIDTKIGIESTFDSKGVDEANQSLDALQSKAAAIQPAATTTASTGDGGAAAQQAADVQTLNAALEEQAAITEETTAAQEGLTTATEAAAAAAQEQAAALDEAVMQNQNVRQTAQELADAETAAAEAQEKGSKAAEEAAKAEAKLKKAMELACKGQKELMKELQRLIKERQKAAKAGDTAAYKKLDTAVQETQTAYSKLTQGIELTRVKMTQQAQMGMQAGQTLGELGKAAAGGGASFAGMAVQVMSLGAAIKAGLGPIGWAMMLLQGLQMAWDYFSASEKEAAEASKKAKEALEDLNKALLKHAEAVAAARAEALKSVADARLREAKEAADAEIAELDRVEAEESAKSAHRIQRAELEAEARKTELDTLLRSGQISKEEYNAQIREIEQGVRNVREAEEKAEQDRARARQEVEGRKAQETLQIQREHYEALEKQQQGIVHNWQTGEISAYEALQAKYKEVESAEELAQKEVDTINAQMEAEKKGKNRKKELARLRAQRTAAENRRKAAEAQKARLDAEAEAQLREMGVQTSIMVNGRRLTGAAMLKYVREQGILLEEARTQVSEAERQVQDQESAARVQTEAEEAFEQRRQAEDRMQAAREAAAEQERAAEARELEWKEKQRGTLAEQERWLEEQLAHMQEGNDLHREYNERLRTVRASRITEEAAKLNETYKTHANYAEEETRTQAEILEADRVALERKLAKLKALAAEAEDEKTREQLNKAIRDTEKQLTGVAQKIALEPIAKSLSKLDETYKVTGDYAKKDSRTQAQILQDDQKALNGRRAELQAALANRHLDAKTREEIQKKLQETEKQLGGLKQAMADNAKAARKWLNELKPPKLKGHNKMATSALKRLADNYKAAAKRAAKAAAKGDTKGLEAAKASMDRYAKSMRRLAKSPDAVTSFHRSAASHVASASLHAEENKKAEKKAADAAKKKQAAQDKAAKHAKRGADAARQQADAQVQGAKNAKKAAGKTGAKAKKNGEDVAQLNGQIKDLQDQMQKLTGEVQKLKPALGGLSSHTAQAVSLMSELAANTAAADQKLSAEIKSCKKAIDSIRRG